MTALATAVSFPRVLVVDDDEPLARALCAWLFELGYQGEWVGTARAAADKMHEEHYAVVMLDLHLPDAHGHGLLRRLKRSGYDVPVVVMSGGAEMNDVVRALRERAADFLKKPFEIEELSTALDRAQALDPALGVAPPSSAAPAMPGAPSGSWAQQPAAPTPVRPAEPTDEAPPPPADKPSPGVLDDDRIRLPVLDPKIASLHEFLSRSDYNMQDVADTVGRDATVAAGVLRAANTAHYNRGKTIESLRDACVRIGPKRVVGIALEVSVQNQFEASRPRFGRILHNMWRNAIVTSRVVGELARGIHRPDAEALQVGALLHNIGELLAVKLLAESSDAADMTDEAIAHEVGRKHEKLGKMLARAWKLPRPICRLAGAHHRAQPGTTGTDEEVVRCLVLAGWALAISAGYSYLTGHDSIALDEYLGPLGLDTETVAPLLEDIAAWEI